MHFTLVSWKEGHGRQCSMKTNFEIGWVEGDIADAVTFDYAQFVDELYQRYQRIIHGTI